MREDRLKKKGEYIYQREYSTFLVRASAMMSRFKIGITLMTMCMIHS